MVAPVSLSRKVPASKQYLAVDPTDLNNVVEAAKKMKFKPRIVWRSVYNMAVLHLFALIGLKHAIFDAQWATLLTAFILFAISILGVGVGAHRLWSHRAYKAKWPLRVIMVIFQTISTQNSVIEWARDHRCHHKWTDTPADPHDTNRGFFFSHIGWLLVKKHPAITEFGKKLDLSDLYSDPILVFQKKYYMPLLFIFTLLLPMGFVMRVCGESAFIAFTVAVALRITIMFHITWMINSVNHFFGYQPYDTTITPRESTITSLVTFGEGGHNFHHSFPQDYRTSEYPYIFNFSTLVIDWSARIGWAYDLKTADEGSVEAIRARKGDTTVNRSKEDKWHS